MADESDEESTFQEERRRYYRSRLIVDVHYDGHDATGVASTKDISVGGFYMNTHASLAEGLLLMVRIPVAEGKQVVAKAEVVYSNPGHGVGLRFHDLSEEDRALIERELRSD